MSCSNECATTESYTIKLLESSYGNIPFCSWPNHSSDMVKWSSRGQLASVHQCSQFFGGKILVHKFQMFTLLQICTDSHPNPARYMKQNLVKCGVISISKKLPRPCQQTSRTVTCHNTQCWQVLFVISVSSMLIDRYATATALHHKHASIQFYSSG